MQTASDEASKAARYNKGENYEHIYFLRLFCLRIHIIITFYVSQVLFVDFFEKFSKIFQISIQI